MSDVLDIVALAPPGLEAELAQELEDCRFSDVVSELGGVAFRGPWSDVWRANLQLRCASRILVRITQFPAMHLAQLDKRARKVRWQDWLTPGAGVALETTCRKSKIYHSGAASQRVGNAITAVLGEKKDSGSEHTVIIRLQNNICQISLDTSGELLHRRGFKQAVAKAPLRETLAALFLRRCGYTGQEPVLDPMCGSGTIPIEAAELALGLLPGRGRSFAFQNLPSFDEGQYAALRDGASVAELPFQIFGLDQNEAAVQSATENADRAGVQSVVRFEHASVSTLQRPEGPPGLILVNPPYGKRVGARQQVGALYQQFGEVVLKRFAGWRVGLVTPDVGLANATKLPWEDVSPPIPHGGLKVKLYRTAAIK